MLSPSLRGGPLNLVVHANVLLLLLACMPARADKPAVDSQLQKNISLGSEQTTSIDRLVHILTMAEMRGGIEREAPGCTDRIPAQFPAVEGTVQSALESVNAAGERYNWKTAEGGILLQFAPPQPSLLDVTIANFTFGPKENPLRIEDRLFSLTEVRARMRNLKLNHHDSEPGFAQPVQKDAEANQIRLKDLTLREALLAISAQHDHKLVWSYQQYNCGDKAYSRFDWRVR